MCACREEKKTSSPGKMHVLRTHFSTSRHTTLRHFYCIKINAEDSLLRFHKVKPVGLSKLPVPLTVAPPGESAIVPGPEKILVKHFIRQPLKSPRDLEGISMALSYKLFIHDNGKRDAVPVLMQIYIKE